MDATATHSEPPRQRPPVRLELASMVGTAAPVAGVGLLNLAISLTDMAMMGYLDRRALASGALVSDVYSIVLNFAAGALSAAAPHLARAHAAGEPGRVGQILGRCLRSMLVLAVVGAVAVWSSPAVLGRLGVALPLPEASTRYAHYMSGAFCLMLLVALARSAMPALGKGRVPFAVMVAAAPLNAVANAILMYGWLGAPRMGLAGAGAASLLVASTCAVALVGYAALSPAMRAFAIPRGLASVSPGAAPGLLRQGAVTGFASLCDTGVFLSSTTLVAMCDAGSVPAHVVVFRSLAITFVILVGWGQAVTIHASRAAAVAAGARLRAVAIAAACGAGVLWLSYATVMALVPDWARPLFDAAHGDHARLVQLAPWAALAASSLVPTVIAAGVMRARFDVTAPAAIAFTGYWLVGFPTMVTLGIVNHQGATGVWTGLALGATTSALASCLYLLVRHVSAGRGLRARPSLAPVPSR